jgi:DNA-binding response OmpR family regulator
VSLRRHRVLIAEDHAPTAKFLVELFASIGWDVTIVGSLEELRIAVAEGNFCCAVLDKHLPNAPGGLPLPMAGDTAMDVVRDYDDRPGPENCHLLPVIVATGASTHHYFVTDQFKRGADDFVAKPFEDDPQRLVRTVQDCMRRAGRADHAQCEALGRAPKVEAAVATPNVRDEGVVRLVIDGVAIASRTSFLINGKRRDLQDGHFVVFLRLCVQHVRTPNEYATGTELGFGTTAQMASRIRKDLADALPEGLVLIQNVRHVGYRLNPLVVIDRIDWAKLSAHSHPTVQQIAAREKKRIA